MHEQTSLFEISLRAERRAEMQSRFDCVGAQTIKINLSIIWFFSLRCYWDLGFYGLMAMLAHLCVIWDSLKLQQCWRKCFGTKSFQVLLSHLDRKLSEANRIAQVALTSNFIIIGIKSNQMEIGFYWLQLCRFSWIRFEALSIRLRIRKVEAKNRRNSITLDKIKFNTRAVRKKLTVGRKSSVLNRLGKCNFPRLVFIVRVETELDPHAFLLLLYKAYMPQELFPSLQSLFWYDAKSTDLLCVTVNYEPPSFKARCLHLIC